MKEVMKGLFKKYKWLLILQVIFILLNIYVLTLPPKIIGNIVDLLYHMEENKSIIIQNTIYLLGVCILLLGIREVWKYVETYVPRKMESDLKNILFKQLTNIKLENIQERKNGELMSYFVKDISEIRVAIRRIFSYGTRIMATAIIVTASMITNVDLKLTIFTLIPIVFTGVIVVKIRKYIETNFRRAQKNFTDLSEFVQESTDAIRTTKAYSQEMSQLKQFIKMNRKLRSSNNAVDVHSTLLTTCINICFGICYAISLLYGSKLVLDGQITTGMFVAFNSYISLFFGPINWLPGLIARLKRAEISYQRLDGIFQIEREKVGTISRMEKMPELKGEIDFRGLSYNYPNTIEPVLENINIHVERGKTLGIIGTVGAGKTTLMNLLTRLYVVPKGKIFIDHTDINDIPLDVIRNNICYITQDNFLFSTSLKENISLFKEEYEEDEIRDSTKKAKIYDEISRMPEELETIIGDRGVDLSGGQKQRVVISRAFLMKSNIIIFDDTFSALDNKTEKELIANVKELTRGKTCIIISNRISDINHADEIIVLEDGKVEERGTHEQLMNQSGKYYRFYQEQSSKEELQVLD